MREWLSWWSATLPRSRPRVRVPSRAFIFLKLDFQASFLCLYTKRIFTYLPALSKQCKYINILLIIYYAYSLFPDRVCSTILFIVASFNCPLAYPNTSPSLVIIKVVGKACCIHKHRIRVSVFLKKRFNFFFGLLVLQIRRCNT